jgi:Protein of unknown function (DUF1572)
MQSYLKAVITNFQSQRWLADEALSRVDDTQLHYKPDPQANSIAILIKHLGGNLKSRWTDFLTTDGEKTWRNRDDEFIDNLPDRDQLLNIWTAGWDTLFATLNSLTPDDLERTIKIRDKDHTVIEAIERSLSHAAYHVGQIVQLARTQLGPEQWKSLSIARNQSMQYRPQGQR